MTVERSFEGLLRAHADGDVLARLVHYAELLERWSRRHNLVSWRDREELVARHLLDALAGQGLLVGETGLLVDVGSGAGLPGPSGHGETSSAWASGLGMKWISPI